MAKTNEEVISIRPVKMAKTTIRIVGDSPLIVHKKKYNRLIALTGVLSAIDEFQEKINGVI